MNYPEHDKLQKVQEKSQAVGEFLEWLTGERKLILAHFPILERTGEPSVHLFPVPVRHEQLIAEFFKIDLKELEQEKRAMLETLRGGK